MAYAVPVLMVAVLATQVAAKPILSGNNPRIDYPDYRGGNKYDHRIKVAIDVIAGGSKVRFQARHVPVLCDVGSRLRVSFTTRRAEFAHGSFVIDAYGFSSNTPFTNDYEEYYFVHGARTSDGLVPSVISPARCAHTLGSAIAHTAKRRVDAQDQVAAADREYRHRKQSKP